MKTSVVRVPSAPLLTLTLALSLSCGPKPKPPAHPERDKPGTGEGPGHAVKRLKGPRAELVGENVTLSGFFEDDAAQHSGGGVARPPAPVRTGNTGDIYRRVAPATVAVRAGRGYGSGVIYSKDGWILTNNHVVRHAAREDFKLKVNVVIGKLGGKGLMHKRKKSYAAYVHKVDPKSDLAVLKLVDPPKDLVAVQIAPRDPVPGASVWSLGHAGIGLAWAIKGGQISAVGRLATHLALLLLQAKKGKGRRSASEAARIKRLERMRKLLQKRMPALVIQSTAKISQGDSGGPLVDVKGRLIGLNSFGRSSRGSRKESNFHIHVAEIRKMVANVPQNPPPIVPDPWVDGGAYGKIGDGDLDGKVDVLVMSVVVPCRGHTHRYRRGYFFDLDQDSFAKRAVPPVKKIVTKRDFDAELMLLVKGRYVYAWYDSDNDGKHDVLLVAHKYYGRVKEAYRIDATGKMKKDSSLVKGKIVRPEIFANSALATRAGVVGGRLFNYRWIKQSGGGVGFPDPLKGAGHAWRLKDYDGDGKPDTIRARGMFSNGFLADLDQSSIGALKAGAKVTAAQRSALDAEFSYIFQKRSRWAWYDRNDDGKFDLLLHASEYPLTIVNDAWTVGADGKLAPAREQLGRLVLQPDLTGNAARFRKIARRLKVPPWAIAGGGGFKSFPDPKRFLGPRAELKHVKKWKNVAVVAARRPCGVTMVDLDRDTARRAKKAKKPVAELVKSGKFDAELVQLRCYRNIWAFYDTDNNGDYDLVLYTSRSTRFAPERAYVLAGGKLALRPQQISCPGLLHPKLFSKRKLTAAMAKLMPALFNTKPDKKCQP